MGIDAYFMGEVNFMTYGQEEFDLRQKLIDLEAAVRSKMTEVNDRDKSAEGWELKKWRGTMKLTKRLKGRT